MNLVKEDLIKEVTLEIKNNEERAFELFVKSKFKEQLEKISVLQKALHTENRNLLELDIPTLEIEFNIKPVPGVRSNRNFWVEKAQDEITLP